MNIEDKIAAIYSFNLSDIDAERMLTLEIAQDNLFQTMDIEDLGVSIDDLGLTVEDINDVSVMNVVSEDELNQENFAAAKTVNLYRYIAFGSSGYVGDIGENTRSFCKNLVRRTQLSLMRYTDILRMNGSNKGMGLNGANVYNVFKWRGGVNCKHIWVKYIYNLDTMKLEQSVDQPVQTGKGDVPNA